MSEKHTNPEHKWAFNEEVQFKATVRRNKLLGLWAAGELGLSGDEAEAYAKTVVSSDFKEPGDEDVFRKVNADLSPKGVSEAAIRQKMAALTVQVREEIEAGK